MGAILFPVVLLVVIYALGHLLQSDYSLPENKAPPKSPPPKVSPSTKELVESVPSEAPDSVPVEESPPPDLPKQFEIPVPPEPRQPTVEEMLLDADHLDGPGFEKWCAQILSKSGFSYVQLTKASGDQGVDIIAVKDDIRYAFQCKCYSSDLGNHPVQEVHAGKSLYHCHVGVVMTNRHFTPGAKELAHATGVLLWDRDKLKSLIQLFHREESAPCIVGPSLFEGNSQSHWD